MAREPTGEGSSPRAERKGADTGRQTLARVLLPALAAVAGLLLAASDFTTLISIEVITVQRERVTGGESHAYSLVLIGIVAVLMAFGASRGARPARLALVALGAAAVGITLLADLPDINSTGLIGSLYEEATARPGIGFYLESLGAVLLLVTSVAMVALDPRRPR